MTALDPAGKWRDEQFSGCWLPPNTCQVADPRGELCLCAKTITSATLHKPESFWSMDRSADVRRTEWLLVAGHPRCFERWKLKMRLVRWPVVLVCMISMFLSIFLFSFSLYRSAAVAAVITGMFSLAIT